MENHHFLIWATSSKGGFPIAMLVYLGVLGLLVVWSILESTAHWGWKVGWRVFGPAPETFGCFKKRFLLCQGCPFNYPVMNCNSTCICTYIYILYNISYHVLHLAPFEMRLPLQTSLIHSTHNKSKHPPTNPHQTHLYKPLMEKSHLQTSPHHIPIKHLIYINIPISKHPPSNPKTHPFLTVQASWILSSSSNLFPAACRLTHPSSGPSPSRFWYWSRPPVTFFWKNLWMAGFPFNTNKTMSFFNLYKGI